MHAAINPLTASLTDPIVNLAVDFVDAVANDTQNTWERLLGNRYERTQVVLFRDAINSACGFAQSASGPFYCPSDHKVYLDLGFFRNPRFSVASGAMAVAFFSLFGASFAMTQFLQDVSGYRALTTGFAFLPMAVAIFAMSRLIPRLLPSIGPKPPTCQNSHSSTATRWRSSVG